MKALCKDHAFVGETSFKKFSDKSRTPRSYGSDGRVLVVPAVNRQYLRLERMGTP